jgi:hypothetical protein
VSVSSHCCGHIIGSPRLPTSCPIVISKSLPIRLILKRKVIETKSPRPLLRLCIHYEFTAIEVFGLQAFILPCCKNTVSVNYSSTLYDISSGLLTHQVDADSSTEHLEPYPVDHQTRSERITKDALNFHLALHPTKKDVDGQASSLKVSSQEVKAQKGGLVDA